MRVPAVITAAVLLTSCDGDVVNHPSGASAALQGSTSSIPAAADLARVAGTTVYFGHQSVGANLLDGLRETATSRALPIHRGAPGGNTSPGIHEFRIGTNGQPASKMADFVAALAPLGESASGIAVFKYCYLDITPDTDVHRLFDEHREAVRQVRERHPGLTLVHVTAPLTADEPGPKRLLKSLLGKPTTRDANRRRHEFNALLRAAFAGEPMFDLAAVESTRPDGSRSYFMVNGEPVHTLAAENTDDGGHLNATGRRAAAAAFVRAIAAATSQRAAAAAAP